jgi:hypothetical protein
LIEVRKARPDDFARAAELLHHSAADMYDRFAGGRQRALRVLERSLAAPGTASSAEVVWVASLDGQVAGAMAAFPVDEAAARARAFLRLALRGAPPWRWRPRRRALTSASRCRRAAATRWTRSR